MRDHLAHQRKHQRLRKKKPPAEGNGKNQKPQKVNMWKSEVKISRLY